MTATRRMRADSIKFPELPGNLYSRPTLIWTLDNSGNTRHRVEASYLAGKLSWNADYVLTVARDDKTADLDGWVTVVNGSGTSFRNARLQLVAGDLNRVRQGLAKLQEMDAMRRDMAAAAPAMAQEAFSDYHLYTLARKTSVNNSETKQVSMGKLAPGVRVSGVPDVGGNHTGGGRGSLVNYGSSNGGSTLMLDGINTDGTAGYYDMTISRIGWGLLSNCVIGCGLPSSRTSKLSRVSVVTSRPSRSVTVTNARTRSLVPRNTGCCASSARPAARIATSAADR